MISLAPLSNILTYKKRMGWNLPWFSSSESDFNVDFGVSTAEGETSGTSVFLRDEARVFRTYFTTGRGDETLGSFWTFLDLTQLGRQENWEDSPEGRPQSEPYVWWRRHDEYDQVAKRVFNPIEIVSSKTAPSQPILSPPPESRALCRRQFFDCITEHCSRH